MNDFVLNTQNMPERRVALITIGLGKPGLLQKLARISQCNGSHLLTG